MPTSTPYDRTTPPSTPQASNNLQTLRHAYGYGLPWYSPAIWPHDLPTSRENSPQDDLHYAFTRDAWLSSETETAGQFVKSPLPSSNQAVNTQPRIVDPSEQSKFIKRKPERDIARLITPLTLGTSKQKMNQTAPAPSSCNGSKPTPEISTTTKATGWVANIRKTRRPSEIFNVNFGFGVASRRLSSDRSPQISPRTSFSTAACSSTLSINASSKRQRVDSTGSDVALGFSIRKPTPVERVRGTKSRSPMMVPRDIPILSRATTLPTPWNKTVVEAHPGRLVDFASHGGVDRSSTSNAMDYDKLRLGAEAYHDYLATSARRRSFPAGERAAKRVREEFQMLAKLEKLDAEAKEFKAITGTGGRKRVCTLAHRGSTQHKMAPQSSTSSSSSSSCSAATTRTTLTTPSTSTSTSTHGSVKLSRKTSDPSFVAFLAHIRASFEARKSAGARWQDYPVFADEAEKGFLDDSPL